MNTSKKILSPKKLLHSKWTAVSPVNKEKHFMVTKFVMPDGIDKPIELIELEAVYSGRIQLLPWAQLNDSNLWIQGWV